MWLSLIENPEAIKSIFRDKLPLLQNVYWKDLEITNGQEIICKVSFDTLEMPDKLPEKWITKNVNTIQIKLNLIDTEILLLDLHNSYPNGILTIEPIEQYKKIAFTSEGKDVFIIKSKWVYLESIVGYTQDFPA